MSSSSKICCTYSLTILMLISSFNYFSLTNAVEKSVGPVASCHGSLVPAGSVIKNCYTRCLLDPEPASRANLEIYRVKANVAGPEVIECTKIRQRQTFTLTWTWSYIKSEMTHEFLKVTKEECDQAINANCPDLKCNHRESDTLKEEYHYASDTIQEATTISLITMPSSIMIEGSLVKISPMSGKSYSPIEDGMSKEDGKIYLWDAKFIISGCPYESVTNYGCDMYQDPDKRRYYMCSPGRFSITAPDSDESDMSPKCDGLKRSIEGFLYKKIAIDQTNSEHSRLAISETKNMIADADYLRHKVQQISTHLDSEICQLQCEMLAVESRGSSRDEAIVRVGLNYYKLYSNGSLSTCLTLHGCRMTKPYILCGNPPRIGVTCTENNGLWDPRSIELKRGGVCLKPDKNEKLQVSMGGEHYIVDDSLKIQINRTSSHGIYLTSFSDLHQSAVQWKISELDTMKPEWSNQKEGPGGLSNTVSVNTTLNTPTFSLGSYVVQGWSSMVSSIESVERTVGYIVGCTLGLIMLIIMIKAKQLFFSRKNKVYNPVNTRSHEVVPSPQWT